MAMVKSIKIAVGSREIDITPAEAEELYIELGQLLDVPNQNFQPLVIREVVEQPITQVPYWRTTPYMTYG